MNDKSYVSRESAICPVCGKQFDTGAILLDRRLRNSMENSTITGYALCETHQKLHDDGYIGFVEIEEGYTPPLNFNNRVEEIAVPRSGNIAHIQRKDAANFIDITPEDLKRPFVFCEYGTIDKLRSMTVGTNPNKVQ